MLYGRGLPRAPLFPLQKSLQFPPPFSQGGTRRPRTGRRGQESAAGFRGRARRRVPLLARRGSGGGGGTCSGGRRSAGGAEDPLGASGAPLLVPRPSSRPAGCAPRRPTAPPSLWACVAVFGKRLPRPSLSPLPRPAASARILVAPPRPQANPPVPAIPSLPGVAGGGGRWSGWGMIRRTWAWDPGPWGLEVSWKEAAGERSEPIAPPHPALALGPYGPKPWGWAHGWGPRVETQARQRREGICSVYLCGACLGAINI